MAYVTDDRKRIKVKRVVEEEVEQVHQIMQFSVTIDPNNEENNEILCSLSEGFEDDGVFNEMDTKGNIIIPSEPICSDKSFQDVVNNIWEELKKLNHVPLRGHVRESRRGNT